MRCRCEVQMWGARWSVARPAVSEREEPLQVAIWEMQMTIWKMGFAIWEMEIAISGRAVLDGWIIPKAACLPRLRGWAGERRWVGRGGEVGGQGRGCGWEGEGRWVGRGG